MSFPGWFDFSVRRTVAELRGVKLAQFSDFGLCRRYMRSTECRLVINVVNMIFWKRMKQFGCKLAQVVHRARTKRPTFGVKGQGHRTPKLHLEAWWRHHSGPIRSSRLSSFGSSVHLQCSVCSTTSGWKCLQNKLVTAKSFIDINSETYKLGLFRK